MFEPLRGVYVIRFSNFEFVWDFVLRISYFAILVGLAALGPPYFGTTYAASRAIINSSRVWITRIRAGESSAAMSASGRHAAFRASVQSHTQTPQSFADRRPHRGRILAYPVGENSASTPPIATAIAPTAARTRSANISIASRARALPPLAASSTLA